MVDPKTAIGGIRNTIRQSSTYLTEVRDKDILLREPDLEKQDTNMLSPFVAIYPIDVVRSSPHDTERVGYVTNSDGQRIGKVFRATFNVPVQVDIYVASGDSDNDATDLGWELSRLLRQYDAKNENKSLPAEDGSALADQGQFLAGDGERADDLTTAPGTRRWRHECQLEFHDEVEVTEGIDTIQVVHTPDELSSGTKTAIEYKY